MTAPKRVLLSLGCTLLGVVTLCLFGVVRALPYGLRYVLPLLEVLPIYTVFSLPGWLLALPFVLIFKDADGFRGWATVVIGTAIGPTFILAWVLYASRGDINWNADRSALMMASVIALLTSSFYVFFLKKTTSQT